MCKYKSILEIIYITDLLWIFFFQILKDLYVKAGCLTISIPITPKVQYPYSNPVSKENLLHKIKRQTDPN